MDEMMAELKSQQQEEYDKNEWCKDEIDKTEDSIKTAGWEKEDLDEKHKELENKITTLQGEIKTLKTEVADMEVANAKLQSEKATTDAVAVEITKAISILEDRVEDGTRPRYRQAQP